jgi:hypothetical protein
MRNYNDFYYIYKYCDNKLENSTDLGQIRTVML